MNNDDTELVKELTKLFNFQIVKYRELKELVQKTVGKLVLSRGDLSGLIGAMEQKKSILDAIQSERQLHNDAIERWQQIKTDIDITSEVDSLNTTLDSAGKCIKEFMDEEDQLQRYLERLLTKSAQ